MTPAAQLLDELVLAGVNVAIAPDDPTSLDLDGTAETLTPDRLDRVKAHKAEMSAILRGDLPPDGCLHHDSACWLDARADDRPGWIRTTCRWCGRFIGFRPKDS